MLQYLLVTIAVAAAVLYSAWSLSPARARFTLLARVDAALARREAAGDAAARSGFLRSRVLAPLLRRAAPGGCGSCGGGSAAPPAARPPRGTHRP